MKFKVTGFMRMTVAAGKHEVVLKSSGNQKITESVSIEEWPAWAKVLAKAAIENDKGLGDVIERTISPIGGDLFKKWYLKTFGKMCGCEVRRDRWNERWPLKPSET